MKFKSFNNQSFSSTPYYQRMPENERRTFDILSSVFHFKLNSYVAENLIDWEKVPQDPIYKIIFPRKEMLLPDDFSFLEDVWEHGMPAKLRMQYLNSFRKKMMPKFISSQNSVPRLNGKPLQGLYNTFKTDLSLFPAPMAITCHSYCSYCFRWIMFNNRDLQNQSSYTDPELPVAWLHENPQVTDVLFTGADPMILGARKMRQYIEPILQVESVKSINISTKSLAWWPYRFTTDKDAGDLLRLLEDIVASGKHLNVPAHFTHPRELDHPEVAKAVARIRSTGANIRTQGPMIQGVNDSAQAWSGLWNKQVEMGMVPYYMFIEADHHPSQCFRIPLAESLQIFKDALANSSTLARSVRGPVFMFDLNRCLLDGTTEVNGQKYFVLKTLQPPPGYDSEGEIRLIPFDPDSKGIGNMHELFHAPKSIPEIVL